MTVIEGELETRIVDFALSTLDRHNLLHFALQHLDKQVDGYTCEKTKNLKTELTRFVDEKMADHDLTAFAIYELIAMFKTYSESGQTDFSSDLIKLGSSISIVYCQAHDDELVREFVSFLFSLSESSGKVMETMPTSIAARYIRVLCSYASRALKEYCTQKGY